MSWAMAVLIILRLSRVGHPRVVIRSCVAVWRRWSFLTNLAAQSQCCTFFKMFNLGSGVWIPYRRGIFKFWSDEHVIARQFLFDFYIRFAWSEDLFIIPNTFEDLEAISVI